MLVEMKWEPSESERERERERKRVCQLVLIKMPPGVVRAEFLALKHEIRILGHLCGFSIMEQVRLYAVWPMENWLGSSLNQIQGWTTVRESYSRALEQGPLGPSGSGSGGRTKRPSPPSSSFTVLASSPPSQTTTLQLQTQRGRKERRKEG